MPPFLPDKLTYFSLCFQDSEFTVTKGPPAEDSSSKLCVLSPGKSDPSAGEGSTKSLADVLAALPAPPGGLKRKHKSDEPSSAFCPPSKLLRSGMKLRVSFVR